MNAVAGATGPDDARLRRAQALASSTGADVTVAKLLLDAKLAGQGAVAGDLLDDQPTVEALQTCWQNLHAANTVEELLAIEADAAAAYFTAWPRRVSMRFAAHDADRVPAQWARFDGRRSAINRVAKGARNAVTPINALLNYGYALAEAECRLAAQAVRLDPGLGVLHVDRKAATPSPSTSSKHCDLPSTATSSPCCKPATSAPTSSTNAATGPAACSRH